MNKLIVLVQPSHGLWDSLFCRLPESILSVAAVPHAKGYNIKIVDQRIHPDWKNRLKRLIDQQPICIGLTALTGPSLGNALEIAAFIKQYNPKTQVVLGGVHATILPEQTIENANIDIVVKGEGDYTFFNLVQALESHSPLENIKGLYLRKDGRKVFTGEAQMIEDLDALADTPYELVEMDKYSAVDLGTGKSVSFQTARGCPFACRFCANELLQKRRWRAMSNSHLVKKIKMLQDGYRYSTFCFLDDCTSANIEHLRAILKAFIELENKITWTTFGIRADLIAKLDYSDIDLLWKSGCRALDIGIESGSDRVLRYLAKNETKDAMRLANKKLARYPIQLKYTFLIGLPTESDEELNESLDFYLQLADENPNAFPMVFTYTPIAGTSLYEDLALHGFMGPTKAEDWVHMDSKSWLHYYPAWIAPRKRKKLETIMISSLFCNKKGSYKLTTPFSKLAFLLYHPLAKFRFKHKFFAFPIEAFLVRNFLK